jgi:tetratricopeptide (TPR) repeat protein
MISDQVLRRFKVESEALGRLQHPGIAQVHDAGTADGRFGSQPYFAMEFIEGRPLPAYAAAHSLDGRARLELMAKVCDAVNHAHQRGILHRDLKPGNVLVDETGQPKILDFGVARIVDSDSQATRQTDVGQLIGTVDYMSPEQTLGDPLGMDVRSDIYSLGVILYELLAGKPPYETKHCSLPEVVRVIRELDPEPLSMIHRDYRGDIEIIVQKALEKDKERRYSSAGQLAADIRLHLADRPIVARPPTATYQIWKFSRRHRAVMIGTASVLAALFAGVIVSTWQAVRATRAEHAAIRQLNRADSEAASAEAVNDFLENDVLAQEDPYRQAGPNAQPDSDLKVRTALDRAAGRITGKFGKQPEVEASIRQTIGETYRNLGLFAEARKQLERALELRRRVLGPEHPKTLITTGRMAQVSVDQGLYSEAEALGHQTLEIQRRVLGAEHPDTLFSMNNLANVIYAQGKYAQAGTLFGQTLEIERRVLGPEHPSTLSSMIGLANILYSLGKFAKAEALYIPALQAHPRVLGSEHPSTLNSMMALAMTYTSQGKYEQAVTLKRQAVEIERRVLGPEHRGTLNSQRSLAITYNTQQKYALAETILGQTLEIQRRVLGTEHPDTLFSMNNLAISYDGLGKHAQAYALFNQTLDLKRRVLGLEHPSTLNTMNELAGAYMSQPKYAQAEPLYKQTLEIRRRVLGPENRDTIETATNLARAYQEQGDFAASESLARGNGRAQRRNQNPGSTSPGPGSRMDR